MVEAVCDLRRERKSHLQRVYVCEKAYESLEKLGLDSKIDAVAVFTGAPDHARHVVECMKHGKHVISAVPACMTLDEAAQMKEMKEETAKTKICHKTLSMEYPKACFGSKCMAWEAYTRVEKKLSKESPGEGWHETKPAFDGIEKKWMREVETGEGDCGLKS